jgi:hypothetical protein
MGHRRQILANERLLMWGIAAIALFWIFVALRGCGLLEVLKRFSS